MKYQAGSRRRAKEYERDIAKWWQENHTFEKSIEQRSADNAYVFYDGPPFLTGIPHHGHLLGSTIKDAVGRYQTMQGKRVERVWGWDCHGLPAENYVEQKLGIKDRREIGSKWSLEDYILTAKESMEHISSEWGDTITRLGRWVEFKNAYRTMDKNYMESVWWAFKQLYDAGKIYEGRKVMMYDTKFATPVAKAEVNMDNESYQTVTDPSAFVKFKLADSERYLLAWTTTPWTLPANLALAVHPDLDYGVYELNGEHLIVATKLATKIFGETKPQETIKGEKLVGLAYQPLVRLLSDQEKKPDTYTVLAADFVSSEDGTGIVHIAPAYGEDDYQLAAQHEVDLVDVLDESGYYLPEVKDKLYELGIRDTDESGIEIWAANKIIAKILEAAGTIWKIEYIKHEYPFNPRSKQRIIYRAFPSWFVKIDDSKTFMLDQNEYINWVPEYLKYGRFAKSIQSAPDWNISRDRFWATAMPVWQGDKGSTIVVGSYAELRDLSGEELEDYHRPWVDNIIIKADEIPDDIKQKYQIEAQPGEVFHRIEKVLDCWFESGAMPFAQMHYPFENKAKFEKNYPADFIVEYVGQVRCWFYYIHFMNSALAKLGAFGKEIEKKGQFYAYKNVLVTGTIAGNDGRKMSKSIHNYTDPNDLMDQFSADSFRFFLLASPVSVGEDIVMSDKDVSDIARKITMIWNVYDFFCTYAEVDNYEGGELLSPEKMLQSVTNPLDIWIISRLHQLRDEVTTGMDAYNIPKALAGVLPFIDDLSNWFVRRSRRRFWKSEDDDDKKEAYDTLHYVLIITSQILAPFAPFLAEELYHKMVDPDASVHLLDWSETGPVNQKIIDQMAQTRAIITEGLALRMRRSEDEDLIKVRQPLSKLIYTGEKLPEFYEQIIKDELNVKEVENGEEMFLDKHLTEELRAEGHARELIRVVQSARKKAGLNVDDRIKLSLSEHIEEPWLDLIKKETLATEFVENGDFNYNTTAKVDGQEVTISLEKTTK